VRWIVRGSGSVKIAWKGEKALAVERAFELR
jgi:hypothetical protein